MPRTIDLEKQARYMQYREGGNRRRKDAKGRVREYRRGDRIEEFQWDTGGVMCPKCGEMRQREEWGRSAKYVDGYALYCKMCMREMMKNPRQRRVLQIGGPGRAWVTPRKRKLWDKRVTRGEKFAVVAPDGQMFWWGKRLKKLGLEEETEFITAMAKAMKNTPPAVDDETAEMLAFWDDVIAKEERT